MRAIYRNLLLLAASGALAVPAVGGGTLRVSNSDPPKPVIWRNAGPTVTIPYHLDAGPLGLLNEATAQAMVNELFQVWGDVPTSNAAPQSLGQIPNGVGGFVNINQTNYLDYLDKGQDDLHPIIADDTGSIHDTLFGANNSVLGFAGFTWAFSGTEARIDEGQALLNGRFLDGNTNNGELTPQNFRGVFVHEFGHYLGLDHSQINRKQAWDADLSNDSAVPTMFPINIHQGTSTEGSSLHADDIAIVSSLYPEPGYLAGVGTITGTVRSAVGGAAFQGMNVIARKVDDPLVTAVSAVSGQMYQSIENGTPETTWGSTNPIYKGKYEITGLPPGNYTVEIEDVDSQFAGGSSVGPVSPALNGGVREKWNGFNESSDPIRDRISEEVIIPVAAGATISGVDFQHNFAQGIYQDFTNTGSNSLANSAFEFAPDAAAPGGYRVRRVGITSFPYDPSGHPTITLADDTFTTFNYFGVDIGVYGANYLSFNLSSNGFITFGNPSVAGEADPTETVAEFMGPNAHVAGLYEDLDPSGGGTVKAGIFSNAVIITFQNVPLKGNPTATNSFQMAFFPDGRIYLSYLNLASATRGICGVSSGGVYSPNYARSLPLNLLQNDTTPPTITLDTPVSGATVSGQVSIGATYSDNAGQIGLDRVYFSLDGVPLGDDPDPPLQATLFSTLYTNGPRRLEAIAYDKSGNVGRAGVTITINNPGAPSFSQAVTGTSLSGGFLNMTLTITNTSGVSASDVTLNRFWVEGTGPTFSGVRRIYANPTSGNPLPRNLGTLAAGQSIAIPLRAYVPSDVTGFTKWVDTGIATVGGSFYTF